MTIIGKILTFLIFVFSLLFLGFAIVINNTNKDPRTKQSWYETVLDLRKAMNNYKEDIKAKEEEIAANRAEIVARTKEQADTIARHTKQLEELSAKVAAAENAKEAAVTKLQQSQVLIATIQSDIEKKTKENLDLSDRIKQLDIKIAGLNQEVTTQKNQRIAAQIERDTLKGRLNENERELARLQQELENSRDQKLAQASPGEASKAAPPPVDVQGKVVGVAGGLISINKGSDHGIAKAHTMEIYRLSPKAEWVARIRIIQVSDHEAVGQIVLPQNRTPTVLPNDLVGSTILATAAGR
jgi:predicted phage tail protein